MRITYPAGRNVVLTSPTGEEYDAREEKIRMPWDVYDLPYQSLRCLWRLSWGDYYPFGYFGRFVGQGSLYRVANTSLNASSLEGWFGKPYLKIVTDTTVGGDVGIVMQTWGDVPVGKKVYLYVVFSTMGGSTGDAIVFEGYHNVQNAVYRPKVRWVKGVGWQASGGGEYSTVPNTPASLNPNDYHALLFSYIVGQRLDKLIVNFYEYDLSNFTLWPFAGGGKRIHFSFEAVTNTGTVTYLCLHEVALFAEK